MRWLLPALASALASAGCPSQSPPEVREPADPVVPSEPAAAPADASPAEEAAAAEAAGTLVLDGTPEIPAELRQRLNQYLNVRGAGVADIAADGKSVLIGTRFAETSQIHLVAAPMGARRQLTFADEPASSATFFPGDTSKILFASDRGGDEKQQLFVLDRASGTSIRITDGESVNRSYTWSRDGKLLALMTNKRNGKDFDVWVMDGADRATARMVVEAKGYFFPVAFSRDNKKLLVGEYVSITKSHLHLVDLASGQRTQLDDPKIESANGGGPFAADGRSVFVTSDRDGEFHQLYRVDLVKNQWKSLTSDIKWDVEGLALDRSGRTLAFTVNEGGISRVYLLDTRTGKRRAARGLPQGLIGGLRFATGADVLGLTLTTATGGSDAYTYDVRRGKLTRWTESEMGGLNPERFSEPELVKVKSFDGLEIPAFYYKPAGEGPHPVVVQIHGGPESQARPWFSSLTQYLIAESRMAVLVPNVRGSSGYGKSYVKLDNGFKREDSLKDIGALLDWVAARPELDAKRVCVTGGSYGGYMVLASLVHFGDRLACGIDVVGISSFVTFLENTADYRRDLRRVEYGDERDPAMRKHLEAISPLNHADKIASALFVAQGANDPRVPASEAEQIVKAVRASGHDVWYMLAKDEGHGFRKRSNRDVYLLLSVMFLEKHLAPL
jgi:dipeptidyl aminopeptidase/acylaminoacyl peptidase